MDGRTILKIFFLMVDLCSRKTKIFIFFAFVWNLFLEVGPEAPTVGGAEGPPSEV